MKLILHIGTEKTGTTSIQTYLYENRDLLIESGFYIPKIFGKINHRKVPAYCVRAEKLDEFHKSNHIVTEEQFIVFKQNLYKEIQDEFKNLPNNIHTVIISSEHFHSRLIFQDEVDNVQKLFAPFFSEIKIITYLRRQIELVTSLYSTDLKSGNIVPELNTFIKNRCVLQSPYFNYVKFLSLWENSFGKENLEVRLFEKTKLYENNLILDFSFFNFGEHLKNMRENLIFPAKENESIAPVGQELLLLLNQKKAKGTFDKYNVIMNKINHIYKGEGKQPDHESAIDVMNIYAHSNEIVRQKYFPSYETLFSSSFEKYKKTDTLLSYEKELKLFSELIGLF